MGQRVNTIIQFTRHKLPRLLLVSVAEQAGLYVSFSLNSLDRFSRDKTEM